MAKLVGKSIKIGGNDYNILKHITNGGNSSIFEVERNQTKYALKIVYKDTDNLKKGNQTVLKYIGACNLLIL